VFYTPETLTISEGEKIVGELSCAPNARNNRDLDITISYATLNSPLTRVEYKMCALVLCFEGYSDQVQVVITIFALPCLPVMSPIYLYYRY
jgi:hypothetical protein